MLKNGDKLNILGYIYKVTFVKDYILDNSTYGTCHYRPQVIKIDKGITEKTPDQYLDTLLHEIQHILNKDPSSRWTEEDEEVFTASQAHLWSAVLIDNPKLVQTISELTSKIAKGKIKW